MHAALTVGAVTLAGTALGTIAYTTVASPPADEASVATAGAAEGQQPDRVACSPPDRVIGGECVTVVHVRPPGAAGPGAIPPAPAPAAPVLAAAPAAPAPAVPVSPVAPVVPVSDDGGWDSFDDHGGDHDDGYEDAAEDAEDATDDRADAAEDAADERADAIEDAADDFEDRADDD